MSQSQQRLPLRSRARRALSPRAVAALPVGLVAVALAILLPLLSMSLIFALAGVVLAVGLCILAVFGLERTAIGLLTLSFFFVPLDDVRPGESFVAASDVFLAGGIMLLIPILIQRPFRLDSLLLFGVGSVFAVTLIGVATSQNFAEAVLVAPRLIVGALVLPTVFLWWRPSVTLVPVFAGAYVAGVVTSTMYGVLGLGFRNFEGRIFGLSTHPNVLGLTALLAVALALYLWDDQPRLRWLIGPAGLICGLGVWESGSRAALVVTVGVVGIYPVLSRSIEAALALTGVAGVGAYLVGRALSIENDSVNVLTRLFGAGSASASDQVRAQHAQEAAEEISRDPFLGSGLAADTLDTHNIYLQVLQAGGIALLVAFVVLLAAVVRRPFLVEARFRLLALAGIAYVVVGPLTPILWDRYIWAVLALPFIVPLSKEVDPPEGERLPLRTRLALRRSA